MINKAHDSIFAHSRVPGPGLENVVGSLHPRGHIEYHTDSHLRCPLILNAILSSVFNRSLLPRTVTWQVSLAKNMRGEAHPFLSERDQIGGSIP
jgi:hypothetical protein